MATSSTVPGTRSTDAHRKKADPENKQSGSANPGEREESSTGRTEQPSSIVSNSPAGQASNDTTGDAIEEALPILPRGIVENTLEVYREVANYDIVPPEKLREYWRVYTITHRKLYDPTANRLESFWWHVWGSKCRNLTGKTLAKLYENISTGPTFVPLRTPTNRYEGPTIPSFVPVPSFTEPRQAEERRNQQDSVTSRSEEIRVDGLESNKSLGAEGGDNGAPLRSAGPLRQSAITGGRKGKGIASQNEDEGESEEMGRDRSVNRGASQEAQVKILSSSSSRPQPGQSILRKPRPSLSGPRPTPRFALPSGAPSEDDEEGSTGASSSENAIASSTASGSGSVGSNKNSRRDSHTAEQSSSSASNSKTPSTKRDGHKSNKSKHSKKKFVVSSAASKRKAVVSKRSGSQSSATSEASGPREMLSPLLRPSEQNPIEEEEELEDESVPPSALSRRSLMSLGSHQQPLPPQQRQMQRHQPRQQQQQQQQQQIQQQSPSPVSSSTTLSPTAESATDSTSSRSKTDVAPTAASSTQRPSFSRQMPGPLATPVSVASSGGSSELEMPRVLRHQQTPNRPSGPSGPISLTRGGPRRQLTLPYEPGQSHRQQVGRMAVTTVAGTLGNASPTTTQLLPSPGVGAGPAIAPRLSRSLSQDSYALHHRQSSEARQSPVLPPGIGTATTAAPSMVAASGVFMDAEGPDPFEMYASTGLGEQPEDPTPGEHPPRSERSSFSYTDQNPAHRPLFTPTRPTPTPRIPFARTRSQLNVILDRERERLGEGSFASWRESRSGRDQQEPLRDREDRESDT